MIKDHFWENILKIVSLFVALSFGAGFYIWNLYLYQFGFIENSLIQTRFILTGIMFFCLHIFGTILPYIKNHYFILLFQFFALVFYFIVYKSGLYQNSPLKLISRHRTYFLKLSSFVVYALALVVLLSFLKFYTLKIFPYIPLSLGGGAPRLISLITDENQIKYFSDLDIPITPNAGDKPAVQTANLCVGYENEEAVLLLLPTRVLSLQKEYIKGFGSLPTEEIDYYNDNVCRPILESWLSKKQKLRGIP